MLCDRCQKRDAKLLYTEIINGIKKEQHLCEECAADYTSFQMEKPLLNSELTLGDLLSTLLEAYTTKGTKETGDSKPDIVCDSCSTTYEEFLQKGRFGCANCYRSFHKELSKTLKGVQGSDVHTGKRPKGFISDTDRILQDFTEIERLSLKLQEAIEKEEFEEAARLRDLIREMKKEETNNA
ncbi:UvrB/UvrC motif-containing protein [Mobilitalea sibirica]|uniref:UvrB/UvrC motif-containing protein n=1 Tax=Mobilitalea sibirica TaxID=1462919 RepID=A0A8J7KUR2_9FIRM|nr:UvrB/UvrC motif-containing protein [Mobilitalea sibirica]MBH1939295.1 UvrB/UvrC motif-containing protein [Mobilitalea sibirica]